MYIGGGMKYCHSAPSCSHSFGEMTTKQSAEYVRTIS